MNIKRIILLFASVASMTILLSGICYADTFKNEPDGFRDLKWGSSFEDVKDNLTYVSTDPSFGGINIYTRNTDDLAIGSGNAQSIEYLYWQGKLYGIYIKMTGYSNWYGIHSALTERFGNGYKPNRYMDNYIWFGDKTLIQSEYREIGDKGKISFISKIVSNQAQSWNKEKAREGSAVGF